MSSVMGFKVVLLSLVAIIGLELLAKRLAAAPRWLSCPVCHVSISIPNSS